MSEKETIILTNNNFSDEIDTYEGSVLVDFWAPWCEPCKALSPLIDEIAKEVSNDMKVCKVNVDENQELAQKLRVMSVPTVIFFKNGKALSRLAGPHTKEDYLTALNNL